MAIDTNKIKGAQIVFYVVSNIQLKIVFVHFGNTDENIWVCLVDEGVSLLENLVVLD